MKCVCFWKGLWVSLGCMCAGWRRVGSGGGRGGGCGGVVVLDALDMHIWFGGGGGGGWGGREGGKNAEMEGVGCGGRLWVGG